MPRAVRLLAAGEPRGDFADTLILDSDQRRMQRGAVVGARGTHVDFDFADPVALRTDDVLLLDNGARVDVVAAPEALIEVRAEVPVLARIAWTLGDRHVPVQILPNRLRLRADAALEPVLASLGGKIARIEAPFEPEGGAYAAQHDHGHDHHGHDHDHDHHGHGGHAQGHGKHG